MNKLLVCLISVLILAAIYQILPVQDQREKGRVERLLGKNLLRLDVGKFDGVKTGMRGSIFTDDKRSGVREFVGRLEVTVVKEFTSTCRILSSKGQVKSGHYVEWDNKLVRKYSCEWLYEQGMRLGDENEYKRAKVCFEKALECFEESTAGKENKNIYTEKQINYCKEKLEKIRQITNRKPGNVAYINRLAASYKEDESKLSAIRFVPKKENERTDRLIGMLKFKVNVADASIIIDGIFVAMTKDQGIQAVTNIPEGFHRISVIKNDYVSNIVDKEIWVSRFWINEEVWANLQKPAGLKVKGTGYFDKAGMEYARIPAGEFIMGAVPADNLAGNWEKPAHRVAITRDFWMSTTEVTVEAYRMFCSETGRKMPDWHYPGHPMAMVRWNDAKAYCEWAGGRLPTEAEWEYAARGGIEGNIFVWGNGLMPIVKGIKQANVADESAFSGNDNNNTSNGYNDGYAVTSPVGFFSANAFGLYDMCGNVSEYCSDWYDANYYVNSPKADPQGPEEGRLHVRRGGSFGSRFGELRPGYNDTRISHRDYAYPQFASPYTGIRVVRDSPPEFRGNVEQIKGILRAERNAFAQAKKENSIESWRALSNLFPNFQYVNLVRKSLSALNEKAKNKAISVQEETAKQLKLKLEFENFIGMKFRLIPNGSFRMGSRYGDDDEQPEHLVTISDPFYMGKYEVTQAQFEKVMNSNPSFELGYNKPAENVPWVDAKEFCRKLSELTGDYYRLPTEAEWEYACRANSTSSYYWGDEYQSDLSWNMQKSGGEVHIVGQKAPNAWGLYDMAGNVWEWCSDRYSADYYSRSPNHDPKGPVFGLYRVKRGGSWTSKFNDGLKSSDRRAHWPILQYVRHSDSVYMPDDDTGFRVVRVIAGQEKNVVRRWRKEAQLEKKTFESAQYKDTIDSWRDFIVRYPDSSFAEQALERIAILQKALERKSLETEKFDDYSLNLPKQVTNSIGMKFKLIPPGSFTMGSNEGFEWFGELPAHTITITKPFTSVYTK